MRALGRFLCVLTLLALLVGCGPAPEVQNASKPVLVVWVPVKGNSMLPSFPESAMVEAKIGVPFSDLKAGDSVIFWDYKRGPAAMTHHRLIQKQGNAWIAQGDNNAFADQSWVTPENYYLLTTGKHSQIVTAAKP